MKKHLIIINLLMVVLSFALPQFAHCDGGNKQEVPTKKYNDPSYPLIDEEGRRAPVRPIIISISAEDGVSIPAVDKDDVQSYSIYDEDGMMLASFTDDLEFANALLSSNGTLEIRIHLDEYILCGWIEL